MAKDHRDNEKRKHVDATTWAILSDYQQRIFYVHYSRQDTKYQLWSTGWKINVWINMNGRVGI